MSFKSYEYYNRNAQSFYENTVNSDMTAITSQFLDLLPPNALILDGGCGSGRDSKQFLNAGHTVTSFDASEKLAQLSTILTGQTTIVMRFQDLSLGQEYDGIWCCASLIHVPKSEIEDVFGRLNNHLKIGGIFYASFRNNGPPKEAIANERLWVSYNEEAIYEATKSFANWEVIKVWNTTDVRENLSDYTFSSDTWLNVLIKKMY